MTNLEMVNARKAYAEILNLNINSEFKDNLKRHARFMTLKNSFVSLL